MKLLVSAVAIVMATVSGCGSGIGNKAGPHPVQASAQPGVETVEVASRQLDMKVSLPAQLLPYQAVDIYPRVTGFLGSIHVDVGSHVRQGEELMRISAPELVAQRSQSE